MGMHATRAGGICVVQVSSRTAPRSLRIRTTLKRHSEAATALECVSAASDIAALLRQQLPCQWFVEGGDSFDFDLAGIVDSFESITLCRYQSDPPAVALDDLNEVLARLLDWADDAQINLTP